jgi:two-component sensor histidine kinase
LNIGVRPENDVFSVRLIQAVNVLSINGIICMIFAAIYGTFVQNNPTSYLILYAIPFFLLTIYLNKVQLVYWAISLLCMSNTLILATYSIRTGEESFTHVLLVLMIIAISLLYRGGENKKVFYFNLCFTLLSIAFVLICFKQNWLVELRDPLIIHSEQRQLNFIILIFCSILFSMAVAVTFHHQHKAMRDALDEQKVLLAEVNHRVKNNLAIIVSLLNLQRDTSSDLKTKDALQDVHDRVMAMALVHTKMYDKKSKNAIELDNYITDLVSEIKRSLDIKKNIDVAIKIEPIQLNVSSAIPLGLILNELITNSIKHAFNGVERPEIKIDFSRSGENHYQLIVHDNGINDPMTKINAENGLGIGLIDSLTEQVDGDSNFEFKDGLTFKLRMPITKI